MRGPPTIHPAKITTILAEINKLQHQRIEGGNLDPRLAMLKQWQSDRLDRTYSDLSKSPRYQPAMRFFLQDTYGARDFSQRNHDIQRMYEFLRPISPEQMIRPLVLTVQLHYLTEELDAQLLEVLVNRLNMDGSLTVPLYAEAYRLCDNYDRRVQQIELIYEIGAILDQVVQMPLSGPMLKMAKGPLKAAGWSDLIGFMERGYEVFKKMHGAKEFLDLVRKRELGALDRIYANDPNPFELTIRNHACPKT